MELSTWHEVSAAVAEAPYPVEVLPADPRRAASCLAALGITAGSWLGGVVANSGGLLVDHGWLRVLGGGHGLLPDVVAESDPSTGLLVVGHDVLGGRYAWLRTRPDVRPSVHYFGPDELGWLDLERGYGEWLGAVLGGALTAFYENLRWPGWEREVAALALDEGISAVPPPFTAEGRDLAAVSRRAVALRELVSFYAETGRQLG
ncbi:DUF2625 family protein [Micromonospora sp. 15K316]|uniref:DUF2625 family protein n=1 Tax=Micromonospora sp. 15K316 TaxID=2530376 RepID=UPI001053A2DA|nr:DUF2625 family protein [Micromonospora sp. 15K316]TDC38973.1 DUF2625 family protein [Micromonospora sp. 15K316]